MSPRTERILDLVICFTFLALTLLWMLCVPPGLD